MRWSIGDWHRFPADDFLSGPTRSALEPLVGRFRDYQVNDAAERATWREIGLTALQRAQPLTLLPTTERAIEFVAHPMLTPVEQALVMQQTVPANRFHEVFPAWRRLAALAEAARADETRMAELRGHVHVMLTGGGAPARDQDDELTRHLNACGLWWLDVTTWSDSLQAVVRLAHWR